MSQRPDPWGPFKSLREWLADSDLPPIVRHVGLEIGKHFDANGYCFVSVETLCERSGWGKTAVKQAIRILTDGPDCPLERTIGGSRRGEGRESTSYRLRPDRVTARPGRQKTGPPCNLEMAASRPEPGRDATTKDSVKDFLKGARELLESAWAQRVGKPPKWFWDDVGPLLSESRPVAVVEAALRCYIANTEASRTSSGAFARRIEHWVQRSKPPRRTIFDTNLSERAS